MKGKPGKHLSFFTESTCQMICFSTVLIHVTLSQHSIIDLVSLTFHSVYHMAFIASPNCFIFSLFSVCARSLQHVTTGFLLVSTNHLFHCLSLSFHREKQWHPSLGYSRMNHTVEPVPFSLTRFLIRAHFPSHTLQHSADLISFLDGQTLK